MYRPEYLNPSDKIAILSTARKVDIAEIQQGINWLRELGLEPVMGKTIDLSENQYAGSDEERAADFQQALDSPEIKAIWFARGGYGSIRIFDLINWDLFILNPKWLVGYSDITIWHNLVNNFYGIQSMHAPMPYTVPSNSMECVHATGDMLFGRHKGIEFHTTSYNIEREISGEIIGGNLSILYSLLGTKTGFNTNGKILYLEDIDEYLYHIDRMFISLKAANKLSGLKGLLIGTFSDVKDNVIPFGKTYQEIILEHCAEYDYPIFFDVPCGHIANNMPLRLGAQVNISVKEKKVFLQYTN